MIQDIGDKVWRVVWQRRKWVLYKDFTIAEEWRANIWVNDLAFKGVDAKMFYIPRGESDFARGSHEIDQDFSHYKNQKEIEADEIIKAVLENIPSKPKE